MEKSGKMMMMTIESDEEVIVEESDAEEEESNLQGEELQEDTNMMRKNKDDVNPDFTFGDTEFIPGAATQSWDFKGIMEKIAKEDPRRAFRSSTQDRIERVKQKKKETKRKKKAAKSSEDNDEDIQMKQNASGDEEELEDSADQGEEVSGSDEASDDDDDDEKDEEGDTGDDEENNTTEESNSDEEKEADISHLEGDQLRLLKTGEVEKEPKKQKKKKKADAEEESTMVPEIDEDPLANSFFEEAEDEDDGSSVAGMLFEQLNLSRPLLRAVEALGFVNPTPIQAKVIPVALAGRDICGSAVTGSGKTAAFVLPILERLLYRPRQVKVSRVLVVAPTRELAAQGFSMLQKLSQFTDINAALVVGGAKNLKSQEAELRSRPDILVCTPGRLIDHITNSQGVHLDDIEILVLDEVDRLLELGFQEEVEQIVQACPKSPQRQTLLFSATMGMQVEQLASLSLYKPVRIKVDDSKQVAHRLIQEFIRIRKSKEKDREAIVVSLLQRSFQKEVIVFFDTKSHVRRMAIILGLLGLNAAEMHGNLNQSQRLEALERFKNAEADVLLCTDVAARGLDIAGVKTVINFDIPRSRPTYIHRVGRTARAGMSGRSVTLVGEQRRPVMKEILRANAAGAKNIKSRTVPDPVVAHFREKINSLAKDIKAVYDEEDLEKEMRKTESEAERAKNIVEHADEIHSRPRREWFQTKKEKEDIQNKSKEEAKALLNRHKNELLEIKNSGKKDKGSGENKTKKGKKDKVDDDSGDEKEKKPHRQNRKKRRRAAARAADEAEAAQDRAEGRVPFTERAMLLHAKKVKKEERLQQQRNDKRPIGELQGAKRNMQVSSAFDQDVRDVKKHDKKETGQSQGKSKKKKNNFEFKEFDPNMRLKKGGKFSKNAFKSKKKYKRR